LIVVNMAIGAIKTKKLGKAVTGIRQTLEES
jgi:hypothetical protein